MDLMLTISLGNAFQLETGHYKETNEQKMENPSPGPSLMWLRSKLPTSFCTPQPLPQGLLAFQYVRDRKARRPWGRGCVKIKMAAMSK